MRSCDRDEQGVHGHRVEPRKGLPHDRAEAARLRLLDERQQGARRVVLAGEHESVHALPASVEEITRSILLELDVRDERQPGEPTLDLANAVEVRLRAREDVDEGQPDGLALAGTDERRPIVAHQELMSVADCYADSLDMLGIRKQCRDDAHARYLELRMPVRPD